MQCPAKKMHLNYNNLHLNLATALPFLVLVLLCYSHLLI